MEESEDAGMSQDGNAGRINRLQVWQNQRNYRGRVLEGVNWKEEVVVS